MVEVVVFGGGGVQGYIEVGMRPEKMRRWGGGGISKEINKLGGVRGRNVCEG